MKKMLLLPFLIILLLFGCITMEPTQPILPERLVVQPDTEFPFQGSWIQCILNSSGNPMRYTYPILKIIENNVTAHEIKNYLWIEYASIDYPPNMSIDPTSNEWAINEKGLLVRYNQLDKETGRFYNVYYARYNK